MPEFIISGNKIDYRLHISKSSNDIIEVTKKNLNNGFSNFVGVGGDGTLHYIVNALAGTDKNLGVIPTGSGNDIAKNLNIPSDIGKCCQIIKKATTKKIDLGLINNFSVARNLDKNMILRFSDCSFIKDKKI